MLPTKTSFKPDNIIKELTICMSSALVAKYVLAGRMTPGGLFLTGGIAGVACVAHDYFFHGQDFQPLKKIRALGIGGLVSLGLTQSLKGRVSMHWTSCLIISFVGGAIVLLKNAYEARKGKVNDPNKEKNEKDKSIQGNQHPGILSLASSTSSNIHSKLRIPKGPSDCLNYSSEPARKSTITLLEPVYETTLTDKKYLIMHSTDFKTLRSICHRGAFGSDYKAIHIDELHLYGLQGKGTYMALWKFPADLYQIDNYVFDQDVDYTEDPVGTCQLGSHYMPPYPKLSRATRTLLITISALKGTKTRTNFTDKTINVHRVDFPNPQIPPVFGVSLGFFCKNFERPTQEEQKKIVACLNTLANLAIGAYLCGNQHLVLLGSYKDERLTPEMFANLLKNNSELKTSICSTLKEAAPESDYNGENMKSKVDEWADNVIRRFATKSNIQEID